MCRFASRTTFVFRAGVVTGSVPARPRVSPVRQPRNVLPYPMPRLTTQMQTRGAPGETGTVMSNAECFPAPAGRGSAYGVLMTVAVDTPLTYGTTTTRRFTQSGSVAHPRTCIVFVRTENPVTLPTGSW